MSEEKVIMPKTLTAENGARVLLTAEFHEVANGPCPECMESGIDDDCEFCDGAGTVQLTVTVSWTTIKEIYAMAVKHLSDDYQEPTVLTPEEKKEGEKKFIEFWGLK